MAKFYFLHVSSGSFWCVLIDCHEEKTSTMILKKQLFLSINLGRGLSPFPNNFKFVIIHEERKTLKEDAKLSQEWTSQQIRCKVRETAENPSITSQIIKALWQMLKVHDSTVRKCLKGYQDSLFALKVAWQQSLGLQSRIWTSHKTFGTMYFRQTRQSGDVWP